MNPLDVEILRALRETSVHLPATELAAGLQVALPTLESRLTELRAAGFEIEARPGLGLRLLQTPDRLVADDLVSRLGKSAFVRRLLVFAETASTNDLALQQGRQGAEGGLVFFAEKQTAGRGRFGREWASASHRGLYFSLLLRPAWPPSAWARLTTWAAVSVASAIEESTGLRVEIKWPNDLQIRGKKIAGILAESGSDAQGRAFAVVGIGVNVNQTKEDFPLEFRDRASSLGSATERELDRAALAVAILRALERNWPQIERQFSELLAQAIRRSVLLGRWIGVRAGTEQKQGRAEGLDEDGHLLLRTEDGRLEVLSAGEVTIVAD